MKYLKAGPRHRRWRNISSANASMSRQKWNRLPLLHYRLTGHFRHTPNNPYKRSNPLPNTCRKDHYRSFDPPSVNQTHLPQEGLRKKVKNRFFSFLPAVSLERTEVPSVPKGGILRFLASHQRAKSGMAALGGGHAVNLVTSKRLMLSVTVITTLPGADGR